MKAALRLTGATLGMYGLNDCRKLLPAVAGVTSESNGMGKALYYNVSLKRKELAKAKLR